MPPRILIADDNPLVRTGLRHLLEHSGPYEIMEASDGQDAIEKALESHPNLVILDLAMPRMDGLTAAGKISQAHPDMPILMYTMHFSRHVELEALKHGVRKVVSKTDSAGLVSAIREFLPAQPASSAQPAIDALPPVNLLDNPAHEMPEPTQIRPDEPEAPSAPEPQTDPPDPKLS